MENAMMLVMARVIAPATAAGRRPKRSAAAAPTNGQIAIAT